MAFDNLGDRPAERRRTARLEEPLSRRMSFLLIAMLSIAGWALLISIVVGLLRLGGY
jgi:hypothetical protein